MLVNSKLALDPQFEEIVKRMMALEKEIEGHKREWKERMESEDSESHGALKTKIEKK